MELTMRSAIFDYYISAFDVASLAETLTKSTFLCFPTARRSPIKKSTHWHHFLRTRHEQPSNPPHRQAAR
jgi:hypothetical protein